MTRTPGPAVVHTAYVADSHIGAQRADEPDGVLHRDIRIHGSKVAALEDAVDRGAKYVPWPHGLTLEEAITAYEASKKSPSSPAVPRKRTKAAPVEPEAEPYPEAVSE